MGHGHTSALRLVVVGSRLSQALVIRYTFRQMHMKRRSALICLAPEGLPAHTQTHSNSYNSQITTEKCMCARYVSDCPRALHMHSISYGPSETGHPSDDGDVGMTRKSLNLPLACADWAARSFCMAPFREHDMANISFPNANGLFSLGPRAFLI